MRRSLGTGFFLLLLCAICGFSQTPTPIPITGNVQGITSGATPYAGVSIQLVNCPAPISIPGTAVIAPQGQQLQADGTGLINSTIWPNDKIDCNGTTGNSQYTLQYIVNGTPTADPVCYQVLSTQGQWNLNNTQPVTCGQTPPNPQDLTVNNLVVNAAIAAATANFSGNVTFNGGFTLSGGLASFAFTGSYPASTWENEASFLSDGASPSTIWTGSQGAVGGMAPVTAGVKIPAGSAAHQASGVFGFADNYSPGTTNGVGGYFVGACEVTANCWGYNTVVYSTAGHPANIYGGEIDLNANNVGDIGYGLAIVGAWSAQPTGQMQAMWIERPVGGSYHWNTGLQIDTGAAPSAAIYINPADVGAGQPSQPIVLVSTAGGSNIQKLYEDSTGAFAIKYQNNAVVTMPQPPATGGFPIGSTLVTYGSVSISGCSATGLAASASGGSFNSGTSGTCSVTITFPITAPRGFACARPSDIGTPADTNSWQQTGYTTTQVGFSGTAVSGDQIVFGPCVAF